MSEFKVVIPARYSSTRLPLKVLLEINGKPIFWHVYKRVLESGFSPSDIYVATDHADIYSKAESLGLNVVMTSTENESGTDRINEVSHKLAWPNETIIINVQGDEPLIPPQLIRKLRDFAITNSQFDITTAVIKLTEIEQLVNPNIVKVALAENGSALYFSRSAIPFNRDDNTNLKSCYKHIGIYTYKVKVLQKVCDNPVSELEKIEKLEQLRPLSLGYKIGALLYNEVIPHGIDVKADFEHVKNIMGGKCEYS
jgi:3-deoxy-manno-octulosonate cytidylyltransferase (CMP-KDO synthetase)